MPRLGDAAMIRRAACAPARCPSERGNPQEEAHRPFPSEIMATWSGREADVEGMTVGGWCKTTGEVCMGWFFLSPREFTLQTTLHYKVKCQKKLPFYLSRVARINASM